MKMLLLALVLGAMSMPASARTADTTAATEEPEATALPERVSPAQFPQLRQRIENELQAGKQYRELTEDDYRSVQTSFHRMESLRRT